MPIYEYVCPSCDLKFELLRPLSKSNDGASCPRCNNGAKRILSTFASFSKGEDGSITSLAGSDSCAACTAATCSSCRP